MSESNVTPNGRNVTPNGIVGFQLKKEQKTQPFDYESQNVTICNSILECIWIFDNRQFR